MGSCFVRVIDQNDENNLDEIEVKVEFPGAIQSVEQYKSMLMGDKADLMIFATTKQNQTFSACSSLDFVFEHETFFRAVTS